MEKIFSSEGIVIKNGKAVKERFDELEKLINSPEIIADGRLYRKLVREQAAIKKSARIYEEWLRVTEELTDCLQAYDNAVDEAEKVLYGEETGLLQKKINTLTQSLTAELLPKDEFDCDNAVIEIRGENGDELFSGLLKEMYSNYARNEGFVCVDDNDSILVKGEGAYAALRKEGGRHVAVNLGSSRSSFGATVAVLPSENAVTAEINDNDVRIDVFHANGAGGQNINKVETAIRMTHIPTGIVVTCQDERSQLKNKERARKILEEKLVEREVSARMEKLNLERKKQIFDNTIIVRKYDFATDKVIDTRTKAETFVSSALKGELNSIIAAERIYFAGKKSRF